MRICLPNKLRYDQALLPHNASPNTTTRPTIRLCSCTRYTCSFSPPLHSTPMRTLETLRALLSTPPGVAQTAPSVHFNA